MVAWTASITVVITICLLPASFGVKPSTDDPVSAKEHQYTALLQRVLTGAEANYNRTVIPATSSCIANRTGPRVKCPFIVHCRLYIIRVQELNDNDETFVITARVQLGWNDSALRWDPKQYGGIKEIILPPDSIWLPSLQVANGADDIIGPFNNGNYWFRVTYDGRVWYHPSGRFATRCTLDLTYYPFDYQRCVLVVESVIHTFAELVLAIRPDKEPVSRGMHAENPMWTLIDANGYATIYRTGARTGFSRIQFWFTLKRKPDYYQRTFLIPLGLLSIIQVLTYLLPIKYIDRVSQATVVLMTAVFLQGYIAEQLPRSSANSLVQTYLNATIGVAVLTVAICTLTIELLQPDEGLQMWGLKLILSPYYRRRKKMKKVTNKANKEEEEQGDGETMQQPDGTVVLLKQQEQSTTNNGKHASIVINKRHSVEHAKPATDQMRRTTLIAALINWLGFLISASIAVWYPLLSFVIFAGKPPPLLTREAVENASYYGD